MKFKNTADIALMVRNLKETADFFQQVMGLDCRQIDDDTYQITTEGYNLYLITGDEFSVTLEFLVPDVDKVKQRLLENDCEIFRWDDRDHWLRHKSGFIFNLDRME